MYKVLNASIAVKYQEVKVHPKFIFILSISESILYTDKLSWHYKEYVVIVGECSIKAMIQTFMRKSVKF